jgi:hypothetical protein
MVQSIDKIHEPLEQTSIDVELLQLLSTMPEDIKIEILHYAKYLADNYIKKITKENPPQKKRRSGILQGTFVLPLPDDFDEPLEEFKEYM